MHLESRAISPAPTLNTLKERKKECFRAFLMVFMMATEDMIQSHIFFFFLLVDYLITFKVNLLE